MLAKAHQWDHVTRDLVLARVHDVPPLRFFSEREARVAQALADVVVPQDDRPPELRVPLVPPLDERLHRGKGPGWRLDGLPPDRELWRAVARGLDEEARAAGGEGFAELAPEARADLWGAFVEGRRVPEAWRAWPREGLVQLVLETFAAAYYAHPYAWSEIGFGGPMFPGVYPRTLLDNEGEAQEVEEPARR